MLAQSPFRLPLTRQAKLEASNYFTFSAVKIRNLVVVGMRILGLHRCGQSDYVDSIRNSLKMAASNHVDSAHGIRG